MRASEQFPGVLVPFSVFLLGKGLTMDERSGHQGALVTFSWRMVVQ